MSIAINDVALTTKLTLMVNPMAHLPVFDATSLTGQCTGDRVSNMRLFSWGGKEKRIGRLNRQFKQCSEKMKSNKYMISICSEVPEFVARAVPPVSFYFLYGPRPSSLTANKTDLQHKFIPHEGRECVRSTERGFSPQPSVF